MLNARVAFAIAAGPPIVAALFLLPPWGWKILVAMVLVLVGWELLLLAGAMLGNATRRAATGVPLVGVLVLMWALPERSQELLLVVACAAWLLTFGWLLRPGFANRPEWLAKTAKGIVAALFVLPAGLALAVLQARDPLWVLILFTLVWAADISAYFSGKVIGGRRLAPRISPGKTVAGLFGGVVAALLVAALWLLGGPVAGPELLVSLAGSLALILVSVGGDLMASLLKRHAGVKDSSRLLPGHGGALDRLDSLLTTAPFFALATHWLSLAA